MSGQGRAEVDDPVRRPLPVREDGVRAGADDPAGPAGYDTEGPLAQSHRSARDDTVTAGAGPLSWWEDASACSVSVSSHGSEVPVTREGRFHG